jgi:hypothetical protein
MDTLQRGLADDLRDDIRSESRRSPRASRSIAVPLKCIFFLTFERTDSIYESRCDFLFESQIRNGESIDEERNQESCRKEESPSEEKEVARQH